MKTLFMILLSCAIHLTTHAEIEYFYIKPESKSHCPESNRTLSFAYAAQNETQKEIKYLEEYLKNYPDKKLENFLKELKAGRVKTKFIKLRENE